MSHLNLPPVDVPGGASPTGSAISGSGSTKSKGSGNRQKRTVFTKEQTEALEAIFKRILPHEPIPKELKIRLSNDLGLPYDTVRTWFQNRRQKARKTGNIDESSSLDNLQPNPLDDSSSDFGPADPFVQNISEQFSQQHLTDQFIPIRQPFVMSNYNEFFTFAEPELQTFTKPQMFRRESAKAMNDTLIAISAPSVSSSTAPAHGSISDTILNINISPVLNTAALNSFSVVISPELTSVHEESTVDPYSDSTTQPQILLYPTPNDTADIDHVVTPPELGVYEQTEYRSKSGSRRGSFCNDDEEAPAERPLSPRFGPYAYARRGSIKDGDALPGSRRSNLAVDAADNFDETVLLGFNPARRGTLDLSPPGDRRGSLPNIGMLSMRRTSVQEDSPAAFTGRRGSLAPEHALMPRN